MQATTTVDALKSKKVDFCYSPPVIERVLKVYSMCFAFK
jgi:hypothetical protein